jgi:DNA-binding CsgD family transcriptional regulator
VVGVVVLVGREDELHLLQRLVEQVALGRGGAVWVQGEPGIGKSTLIAAGLGDAERDGCRIHSARVYERSPTFPLQVLLEALGVDPNGPISAANASDPETTRASRAEIMSLLHGDRVGLVTPRDTVAAVADRLVALVHRLCAISPMILVFDDAQWADEAALGVLLRLGRSLRQLPLLLVIAVRPVPQRAELSALRDALHEADLLTLDVGPFGDLEAKEMARQLMGEPPGPMLAEQLTAAGGNPLYLRELIDALVRESRLSLRAGEVELIGRPVDLPTTLPAAIDRRLRFLSEPVISALRVAAVLGPTFSVADLGIVTGQRAHDLVDVVGEAVGAGVLTEHDPAALMFRHVLVHQTLYEGMPASLRSALHRQVAESLALAGAPPARVAEHLLAVPPPVDAWMIDWITDAAPTLSHRAPRVAVELLKRAREGLSWQDSRRERMDADLAVAHLMLGDNEQVVQSARPVLEYTRDPSIAGSVGWTLAYALSRLGRLDQAIEATERVLARGGLPPIWSARLHARQAMSLFAVGRYDTARIEAERGEAEGAEAGDRIAVGYSLYTLAQLEFYDRRRAGTAKGVIERALAVLGDEPQAIDLMLLLMVNLGGALGGLGQPAEADRLFGQVAVLAERATPPRQAHVRVLIAVYAFYRGRWDEMLAELAAAAELPLDATYRRFLTGPMAQVALHRNDRTALAAYVRGTEDVAPVDTEVSILVELLRVAWALAAERDANPAEALRRLQSTFDPQGTLEFTRLGVVSTLWLPDVVRLALTVGEAAVAGAAAKACAREAEHQARPGPQAAAQHCRGLLDADPSAVESAADSFHRIGYPLFQAQALENAAVVHAEKGESDAAHTAHVEAVRIYDGLAASWDILRADARLRQYNIRRGVRGARQRPKVGWEALTPTEEKIALLVAAGQSNPDIANQLFLSRRTVDSHVSHILAKLSAKSRVEIALAAEHRKKAG